MYKHTKLNYLYSNKSNTIIRECLEKGEIVSRLNSCYTLDVSVRKGMWKLIMSSGTWMSCRRILTQSSCLRSQWIHSSKAWISDGSNSFPFLPYLWEHRKISSTFKWVQFSPKYRNVSHLSVLDKHAGILCSRLTSTEFWNILVVLSGTLHWGAYTSTVPVF